MKKLVIFGNTVVAKLAHFYFQRDSGYQVIAFTVDKAYISDPTFLGLPVVDFRQVEKQFPPAEYEIFVAVGPNQMNAVRERKFREAKEKGYACASYVSPNSVCHSKLGENSLVADQSVINPFSEIGSNNFFWEFSLICNDAVIRDNCYFSPRSIVSSYCEIKSNSVVGTSSIIKARVTVAEKTLVGASCYISKDTEFKGVYGEKSSPLLGCISDKIDISL